MRGWFRLATVLTAFWLFGCAVVLLIELSQLPTSRDCTEAKPSFEVFFRSTKIQAIYVRYKPSGDIVGFPTTMNRAEIEDILHKHAPKYFETTNAAIEWNVSVDKPLDFYRIWFDGHRFISFAIFPAIAIFVAVLVVGCGTRWVVQGFRK
jgi:hypothetical protein